MRFGVVDVELPLCDGSAAGIEKGSVVFATGTGAFLNGRLTLPSINKPQKINVSCVSDLWMSLPA